MEAMQAKLAQMASEILHHQTIALELGARVAAAEAQAADLQKNLKAEQDKSAASSQELQRLNEEHVRLQEQLQETRKQVPSPFLF